MIIQIALDPRPEEALPSLTWTPMPITEDPALLECMVEDWLKGPPEYRPHGIWATQTQQIYDLILAQGLASIRSSPEVVLRACGIQCLSPLFGVLEEAAKEYQQFTAAEQALVTQFYALAGRDPRKFLFPHQTCLIDIDTNAWRLAALYGQVHGALPLTRIQASPLGAPGYVFFVNNIPYTHDVLDAYMRYATAAPHLDFSACTGLVEIGPGCGIQADVLHQLFPQLSLALFELAPQQYVCTQYLKGRFGAAVLDYRETRRWTTIPPLVPGTIGVFGTWQFPFLAGPPGGRFGWSSATFGEMSRPEVAGYLQRFSAVVDAVYLCQTSRGKMVYCPEDRVTEEVFTGYLGPTFQKVWDGRTQRATRVEHEIGFYRDYVFRRQTA